MTNEDLKELLEYLNIGDPIKDRYDEGELIADLSFALAMERNLVIDEQ